MRFDVHYEAETGSTNTDLLALARAGARPGTVLRAGHQTSGRGRLGRRWQAPPGSSLLASILLPAGPVPFLVVARVALAASDACRDLAGVDADLKWPNDLLVDDRKLAGVLAEADSARPLVVVGIGCNLTWPAGSGSGDERPDVDHDVEDIEDVEDVEDRATALSHHVAVTPGPAELLDGLLARLDRWLDRRADDVLEAYRLRCATLGRVVRVVLPDRVIVGEATGLTSWGELEVRSATGTQLVRAGDVVHVRPR